MGSLPTAPKLSLLALLTAALYVVFTLLPGSNSLMVLWPWVFVWQVTVLLPIGWLLFQLWQRPLADFRLGHRLDWPMGLTVIGLVISSNFVAFPQIARWYAWAALGGLAAIYGLTGWLRSQHQAHRLLIFQGVLGIAFIGLSLGLWTFQTLLPELARLETIREFGVAASFSFRLTSLRNWHPIGHQNYVAGYLVLILPLLVGLGITQKGRWQWVWWAGLGLGLVDFYTTSSRGGLLGLAVLGAVAFAIALWRSSLPRWQLWSFGAAGAAILLGLLLANNRLRTIFLSLLQGQLAGGELAYRTITNLVGWNMGIAHPWTGAGLGSVPVMYQAYRPSWAGREAELAYQLHSTPAQLWAEMGIWGGLITLAFGIVLLPLVVRWMQQSASGDSNPGLPPVLIWSLFSGLLAYGVISLTDYQLDIVGISGILAIYLAVLAYEFRLRFPIEPLAPTPRPWHRYGAMAGLGAIAVIVIWLVPVHRAWAISSDSFAALQRDDVPRFVQQLEQAHDLAPWQPYYPYQLGWNLGDLSYQAESPEQATAFRALGIDWLARGVEVSPYQEFGHSNLGWLLLNTQPQQASAAFAQSAQLVPAKRGVFFGLGFSLLLQGETDLAVDAMVLELLRYPMQFTSPVWQLGQFASIYPDVVEALEAKCAELLATVPAESDLAQYLHQVRGGWRWWLEDEAGAQADWQQVENPLNSVLLALSAEVEPMDLINALPDSPSKFALMAWQTPQERQALLEKAWVSVPADVPQLSDSLPPPDTIEQLVSSMNNADSFNQWLRELAPSWRPRFQRTGFGALSRQIDGPLPSDFLPIIENVAMTKFFDEMLPTATYLPALDQSLDAARLTLTQTINERT